jgi:hypothetical protein
MALALAMLMLMALACSRGSSAPRPSGQDPAELVRTAADASLDPAVRIAAIDALGTLADRAGQVSPTLRALLGDPAPDIAAHAKIALRRVEGKGALSFARTAVIGASVSAGFLGTPMSQVLDESIAGKHAVENLAEVYFFRSPPENGAAQLRAALDFQPTLLFAIDYLFWYMYVSGADLGDRRIRLEAALRSLESLDVPIILGDIPDMRTARAWMLPPAVVPPPDHLQALNQALREWARDKLHVHLVPLADWAGPLFTGGTVTQKGKTFTAKQLMSLDGLHLNPAGMRYLMRNIDMDLSRAFPDTPEQALRVAD